MWLFMSITKLFSKSCHWGKLPGQELNLNQNKTQHFPFQAEHPTCFQKDTYVLRRGTGRMHPNRWQRIPLKRKGRGKEQVKGTIKDYTVYFYVVWIFSLESIFTCYLQNKKQNNWHKEDVCSLRSLRRGLTHHLRISRCYMASWCVRALSALSWKYGP